MVKNKKVGVISLGCDKNRVDTEKMLAILAKTQVLTSDIEDAQIIIINTCAFINQARKEAIEEILQTAAYKSDKLEKLIVTGCLPQKFTSELFSSLKEADAFLGVSDYGRLQEVIDRIYTGERVCAVGEPRYACGAERVLTTDGYAYLKIADGCSNHCTYCLIPYIRGKYRSAPMEELVKEAENLGEIDELIFVAQDVTAYGKDLESQKSLPQLIRAISALKNVHSIRLLYCYPENITDELIREFQGNPKLIRYIDIPFQHADDRILKLMNRKGTGEGYLTLIERLKKDIPGIAIRSTFITGFPTESEEQFGKLKEFIEKAKLFNAGFFKYSREKGTPAYKLEGQIPERVKTERLKKLYAVQKKVVKENFKLLKNKIFNVYTEGFDEERMVYYGRAYFNAPDIDGKVYFFSSEPVEIGERVNIRITKAEEYDLYGEKI